MSSEDSPAVQRLAALVGPYGQLPIAFDRAQRKTDGAAAERWQPVVAALQEALGVVSGLAAGYDELPSNAGELGPCGRCGATTAMRIYGQSFHYTCWLAAGCPTEPVAQATTPPPATEPQPNEQTTVDHAQQEQDTGDNEAAAATESAPQRQGKAQYEVPADEEMAAFARAVRTNFPDATAHQIEQALQQWHEHVQVKTPRGEARPFQFQSKPGYSGVLLYELLMSIHGNMPRPDRVDSDLVQGLPFHETTLHSWGFTVPETEPQDGEFVTALDVKAQYLGGASSVELGFDLVEEETQPDADRVRDLLRLPGWVELASLPDLDSLPVYAREVVSKADTGWMLPTPIAEYLARDHKLSLEIARAVVWPKTNRPNPKGGKPIANVGKRLAKWAEVVNGGRVSLEHATAKDEPGAAMALSVLKYMYSSFLGGMLASDPEKGGFNDRGTMRPDWKGTLEAQVTANAWRAWDKVTLPAGARILGGLKDTIWVVSPADEPVRPKGLRYADQPGEHLYRAGGWRVDGFGPVTRKLIDAHAMGRSGTMQRLLKQSA